MYDQSAKAGVAKATMIEGRLNHSICPPPLFFLSTPSPPLLYCFSGGSDQALKGYEGRVERCG